MYVVVVIVVAAAAAASAVVTNVNQCYPSTQDHRDHVAQADVSSLLSMSSFVVVIFNTRRSGFVP